MKTGHCAKAGRSLYWTEVRHACSPSIQNFHEERDGWQEAGTVINDPFLPHLLCSPVCFRSSAHKTNAAVVQPGLLAFEPAPPREDVSSQLTATLTPRQKTAGFVRNLLHRRTALISLANAEVRLLPASLGLLPLHSVNERPKGAARKSNVGTARQREIPVCVASREMDTRKYTNLDRRCRVWKEERAAGRGSRCPPSGDLFWWEMMLLVLRKLKTLGEEGSWVYNSGNKYPLGNSGVWFERAHYGDGLS